MACVIDCCREDESPVGSEDGGESNPAGSRPSGKRREGMKNSVGQRLDVLLDHYIVVCLFLAVFMLTFVGVGSVTVVSLMGLALCMVGLAQRHVRADLWVVLPLAAYQLVSMLSSYVTYGNIVDGYASTQMIYLVIYLVMACLSSGELRLLRQLCAVWAGVVATVGVAQFAYRAAVLGSARRLSGVLGNPNAMGMFLVTGWFLLRDCLPVQEEGRPSWLCCLEPVLLTALAMTLSMGSFAALAAGILALCVEEKRRSTARGTLRYACALLAGAVLAMGTGLLAYLAAARTDVPWFCLPVLLYAAALAVCWPRLGVFLRAKPRAAAGLTAVGVLVAAAAVAVRPSAAATFAERIEMMGSGLGYLMRSPLLGIGPYQWRIQDLYDGGKYFNTWHIHNVWIHVGAELGLVAVAMLAVLAVRFWRKRKTPGQRAGFTAFLVHNMMDTSFFYLGITALLLSAAGDPGAGGKMLAGGAARAFLGVLAVIFAYDLFRYLTV